MSKSKDEDKIRFQNTQIPMHLNCQNNMTFQSLYNPNFKRSLLV